jgi:hypothetical protein
MDAAKSNRLYPSYTTAQLKTFVIVESDPVIAARMQGEIDRREAGLSNILVTPQIKGGRATPRIGRM